MEEPMKSLHRKGAIMIKLIASDLDGTILQGSAQTVAPEIIDTINQLIRKGYYFIAASGRSYSNIKLLFEGVTEPMLIISENGGMYSLNNKIHVPAYHTRETVTTLVNTLSQDPDCELAYACEDTTYVARNNKAFSHHLKHVVRYHITPVDDFLALDILPIKLAICNSNGIQHSEKKYKDLLSDKVNVMTSGNKWLDFMPYGINKGAALQHIADSLGITADECMAFGDQWNDAEMLSFAGTSFAMKNAVPGIAELCTHTTDSVLKELQKLL